MAAIATSIRLEARHGLVYAFVVLLGAAWLLTGMQLLPAVELLALLAGVLVVDVAFIPRRHVNACDGHCLRASWWASASPSSYGSLPSPPCAILLITMGTSAWAYLRHCGRWG